jgi:hypothetical protein
MNGNGNRRTKVPKSAVEVERKSQSPGTHATPCMDSLLDAALAGRSCFLGC